MRIFSKNKYIEAEGMDDYNKRYKGNDGKSWVDDCDGLPSIDGKVNVGDLIWYGSFPEWEIEVEDDRE